MNSFIDMINENIVTEREKEAQYENWKPEVEWEDNPKIKRGEPLNPGEYITRRVEHNKACIYCGKVCYKNGGKLCAGFKDIVYPQCVYCKDTKVRCKCALGQLQEQLKHL